VLFYIYPMKFMFSWATGQSHGRTDSRNLLIIYSVGFIGIFALFLLMYIHAWRKRDELELNEVERHDTITSMWMYGSYVAIGLVSCAIACFAPGGQVGYGGLVYWLIGPVSAFIGAKRGAARRRVEEQPEMDMQPAEA
jgi:hypothetical protein